MRPLRIFITVGVEIGKTCLVKILITFLTNTSNLYSGTLKKRNALLLGPIAVVASNIDRTTISAGLEIAQNCTMCNSHYLLVMKFIARLLQINQNLCEIFGCSEAVPFSGKIIIFVGDLFQLLPVEAPGMFSAYISIFGSIFSVTEFVQHV